jgi:lipopolysaccharide exporter
MENKADKFIEQPGADQPPVLSESLKAEPDLYRRSVEGGAWVMGIRISVQTLAFIKTFIFANFLIVQDLGLMAVAVMLMDILVTFSETGLQQKLIQEKGDIRGFLDTAWTVKIIRGLLLSTLMFAAAPLAASLKVPPEKVALTIALIRVIGFTFILSALENIGVVMFRKDLDFRQVSLLKIPPVLTDILVSIAIVLFSRSVWGFVIGRLCGNIVAVALSYVLSPYRPRLAFDWQKFKTMWTFGRWVFGITILNFLVSEGDDFFIWGYLGITQLALYRYAFRFSNMPATEITNTFSQVFFPAFSKIQNDIPRLREAYLKILTVISVLAFPVSGLVFILGPDFVRLFLKADLHPMIPALQVLAFKGLFRSLGATRGPLFLAMGKPKMQWVFHCIRLVTLAALIYPLTRAWGIVGTSLATVLIAVLINPLGFWLACRYLHCPKWKMLQPSLIPLLAAAGMGVLLAAIRTNYPEKISYGLFVGLLALGMIVYTVLILLFDSMNQYRICRIAKEQIQLFQKKCTAETV